jgi:hypothetical protein
MRALHDSGTAVIDVRFISGYLDPTCARVPHVKRRWLVTRWIPIANATIPVRHSACGAHAVLTAFTRSSHTCLDHRAARPISGAEGGAVADGYVHPVRDLS